MNENLRRALGALARARRAGAADEAPPPGAGADRTWGADGARVRMGAEPGLPLPGTATVADAGVESFLPGAIWRGERGTVYVHERLRSAIEAPQPSWGRLESPPEEDGALAALAAAGLERALFLDLETGGFASSPVFLAGLMHWNGSDFVMRQLFARHYGEEAALLARLAELARGFDHLVTFNGKSYDAPLLAMRALVHGVRLELPRSHLDLLHASRRRWKHLLPDCRLQTLEWRICRRRRRGDVPGEEVPGLYHDWVRTGNPWRLVPVFHHNLLDVITMAEILAALCRGATPRGRWLDVEAGA